MIQPEFFVLHWKIAIFLCAFWLWISVSFTLRMWLVHKSAKRMKKILWSVMLLVPLFGWLAYGAWFRIPDYHDTPIPPHDGLGGA